MIVAALQPGYLPWIGFFNLMKSCDLFIIEDSLQYTKQDWRNRNRIRTREGTAYLTVPVRKCHVDTPINHVEIDSSQHWGVKHMRLLRHNYAKAPYWREYEPFLEDSFLRPWGSLLELDIHFIDFIAQAFGISVKRRMLSDIPVTFGENKTASLVELTLAVGGEAFMEGASGRAFIDTGMFEAAGLRISFQNYLAPPYRQQFSPFVPYLSALDLLLNEGPDGVAFI